MTARGEERARGGPGALDVPGPAEEDVLREDEGEEIEAHAPSGDEERDDDDRRDDDERQPRTDEKRRADQGKQCGPRRHERRVDDREGAQDDERVDRMERDPDRGEDGEERKRDQPAAERASQEGGLRRRRADGVRSRGGRDRRQDRRQQHAGGDERGELRLEVLRGIEHLPDRKRDRRRRELLGDRQREYERAGNEQPRIRMERQAPGRGIEPAGREVVEAADRDEHEQR